MYIPFRNISVPDRLKVVHETNYCEILFPVHTREVNTKANSPAFTANDVSTLFSKHNPILETPLIGSTGSDRSGNSRRQAVNINKNQPHPPGSEEYSQQGSNTSRKKQ